MKRTTVMELIRLTCLDCKCEQSLEVRFCKAITCPLWRHRMGREEHDNLYTKKPMSEKQRMSVSKLNGGENEVI